MRRSCAGARMTAGGRQVRRARPPAVVRRIAPAAKAALNNFRARALSCMNMTPPHRSRLAHQRQRSPDDSRLERAFARIADSDLRLGNAVVLLRDARENYPAWIEAIRSARSVVHFENFI